MPTREQLLVGDAIDLAAVGSPEPSLMTRTAALPQNSHGRLSQAVRPPQFV
jgi:hypothetical protein